MQEKNADYFIQHLNLQPHPEGGYYKETYRAAESVAAGALPERFAGDRHFSTAIYYLLQKGNFSCFHRIKSDECWHWYAGDTLLIHIIDEGNYYCVRLGSKIENGETFQLVVPAMAWFAAELEYESNFVLSGCTVAPGFDFSDFEMADQHFLLKEYAKHAMLITRLSPGVL